MSYQPVTRRTTSTTAVLSVCFGVAAWLALPFVGAIAAIVLGHIARGEIRRAPAGTVEGDTMAILGLVFGYSQLGLLLLGLLFFLAAMLLGLGMFSQIFH